MNCTPSKRSSELFDALASIRSGAWVVLLSGLVAGCSGRTGRLESEAFSRSAPERVLVERVENRTTRALGAVEFGGPAQRLLFGARTVDFLGLIAREIRECLAEKGYELVAAPIESGEGDADSDARLDGAGDTRLDGAAWEEEDSRGEPGGFARRASNGVELREDAAVLETRVDEFTANLVRPLSFDLRYRIEMRAGQSGELLYGGTFRARGVENRQAPAQIGFVRDEVRSSVRAALSALPPAPRAR